MDKLGFTVMAGLLGVSSLAFGQDHENRFDTLDSDGNGSVSFAEFQESGINMITRIDADNDGSLTLDEFLNARPQRGPRREHRSESEGGPSEERRAEIQARMAERATQHFQEMDLDGDDLISVSEFQEASFLRMDRDNNGVLTVEELRPPRGRRGHGRRGEQEPQA